MTASAKALEVSKGLQKRAQDVYQNLDELSGGNYKRFQQAIEKAEETISMRRTLDPEAVTKAEKDLATAKAGLAGLQSKLVQGGVDLKVIRLADQQYGQAKALEDFSKKVRAAEILGGQLKPTSSSILDTGLKNMKPGRLDQALGPHAVGLKQEIIEANKDVAAQQAAKLSAQREAASIRDTASKAKGEIQTIRGRQKLGAALVGGAGIEEGFRRLSGSR
jgi:hypothetical protein